MNFIPIEQRAYISENGKCCLKMVSAVPGGGSMTLCLPMPGTAQYISYLSVVIKSRNKHEEK